MLAPEEKLRLKWHLVKQLVLFESLLNDKILPFFQVAVLHSKQLENEQKCKY